MHAQYCPVQWHAPDVCVLNEFGCYAKEWSWSEEDGSHQRRHTIATLARILIARGYTLVVSKVAFPTAIAVREDQLVKGSTRHLKLSEERGAVSCRLRLATETETGGTIEVCITGTHLDHMDGRCRLREAQALLSGLDVARGVKQQNWLPELVCGDFNQQRAVDYTVAEWGEICRGKIRRNTAFASCPESDGVHAALQSAVPPFECCYDSAESARNWPEGAPPPPTHWTSTVVDYTYSRSGSAAAVKCDSVYIASSNLSDHRPVITDWTFWST